MRPPPKFQEVTREYVQAARQGAVVRVPIANVIAFVSDHHYATAITSSGDLLLTTSMVALAQVYGDEVLRVHNRHLVFKRCIRSIHRVGDNTHRLSVDDLRGGRLWRVPVSRPMVKTVKQMLAGAP